MMISFIIDTELPGVDCSDFFLFSMHFLL